MSEFRDPYKNLDAKDLNCTTITIGKADQAYLYGLFPSRSVTQVTMNILLSRFVEACKQHGLREYAPESFRNAITGAVITLGQHPPSEAFGEDDRRGTGTVGEV